MLKQAVLSLVSLTLLASTPQAPLDKSEFAADVKREFTHAWEGYKKYAWGYDELLPVSKAGKNWHSETLHMTPVDALTTMILMGMREEADRTREHIVHNLRFDKDISVKNFEITIRILGGLLSAHQLTGDKRLLAMADDLGTRLLPAFNSPTGMPYMYVNMKTGQTRGAETNPAEIGTLILEFGTLAKLTGKPVYFEKAKKALVELYKRRGKTGLVGQGINVETGQWVNRRTHVGGAIDSYYEYLLKCEKLFGDSECGEMWRTSVAALHRHLADEMPGSRLWYGVADMDTGQRLATTFGSLHAFLPSVLALGGDVERAKRLQDSAFAMWSLHGIEPEGFDYKEMRATRAGYQLRPEIIESAYYLAHYTKDPKYVEMGRTMFADLKQHCRTETGYTVLQSVITKEKGDLMHSFFLAETLKYAYLIAAPDALDFNSVVFNTEAHPLRRTWP